MEDILQVLQTSWPILLMVVIFYFLLWRPQKKQQKERANLLGSLKKGQKSLQLAVFMVKSLNLMMKSKGSSI